MKSKIVYVIFICIFTSCTFACFFPALISPFSYASTNKHEQTNINDAFELEPNPDMPNMPSAPLKVEKLNWFSVVNTLFKKFSDARVIDIKSGLEYHVKRVGGYNHADVETLTKKDTAILKSLYGDVFSWARRPVWVEINGIFVAASINAMPHSYEYILDNNESGHTCIHFYMSRTHGSNNLDSDHQSAVDYSYSNGDLINYYFGIYK
ncbi:MAG: hypothetical protein RR400_03365 [Clostridia bacterium]